MSIWVVVNEGAVRVNSILAKFRHGTSKMRKIQVLRDKCFALFLFRTVSGPVIVLEGCLIGHVLH